MKYSTNLSRLPKESKEKIMKLQESNYYKITDHELKTGLLMIKFTESVEF